jgi:hypothetical protein
MKAEYKEGPEARENFEKLATAVLRAGNPTKEPKEGLYTHACQAFYYPCNGAAEAAPLQTIPQFDFFSRLGVGLQQKAEPIGTSQFVA